ncbi:MAG: 4Fe-4S binding protein, partial [Thermodesulfobacteriota bacterium]
QQVSIESVVRGIGVAHVSVIKPYNVKKSIAAVKEAIAHEGVSVIIARQNCVLFDKSLKKLVGRPFYVSDRCKDHRVCINELGCPAFYVKDGRVGIDAAICTGCGVCAQICPEHAILPLKKKEQAETEATL